MAVEACILHGHTVDLIPSSIELSTLEISLVGIMSREHILKQVFYAPQEKVAQAYQSFCCEYLEGEREE